MEDGRVDALIARNRCLQAIEGSGEDTETKRALWKAALRYHQRVKVERPGLLPGECRTGALPRATWGGVGGARDSVW